MMHESTYPNDLQDRFPDDTSTTARSIMESSKEYTEMMETMEKLQSLGRRNRRKIIKPSFTNSVRKAFKK